MIGFIDDYRGAYPDVANERLIAYFVPRGIQINQHG